MVASTITIASPPTVAEATADMIAFMAGQSGVVTDFNPGSQIRTGAEAAASIMDTQGIIAQALAFQALVYSAYAAFGIEQLLALSSVGTVTFITGTGGSPPPAVQDVAIPAGTLLSTVGGTQFQTTASVTLLNGTTSIDAPVEAVVAGANGNVNGNFITQIVTGIPYPLQVTNAARTTGGADAETAAQTLARFTARVASIGLSTPVAIANACIGVMASGTSERVLYSTVYEPWIPMVASGLTVSGIAGFEVFLDNGSGTATGALIASVKTVLDGIRALSLNGFRPAGVPYVVSAVTPVDCSVVVAGTAIYSSLDPILVLNAETAVQNYFDSLQFGDTAEITQIIAAVANAVSGQITSLSVTLLDHLGVSQVSITPLIYERMLLTNVTATFT